MRQCCPECFGDRWFRDSYFPLKSKIKGTCDYCGSLNVDLLNPQDLAVYLTLVVDVYEPNGVGQPLAKWLKDDWDLFSHPRMGIQEANELLAEALDRKDIVTQKFAPTTVFESAGLAQWESLRREIMHQNRWFFSDGLDSEWLKLLLDNLSLEYEESAWFRARVLDGDSPFDISEMGAPPTRRATNGRVNPAGIPYLYLGSSPKTAATEIRPHTGDKICVAEFAVPAVVVADLRSPRKIVSPFILPSTSAIGQLRADLPFLEKVGEELTRPVLPTSAAIDYIPSQYLCEFIKTCGFAGVVYRSSVSDGFNMALFDPELAMGGQVSLWQVAEVAVTVEPIPSGGYIAA